MKKENISWKSEYSVGLAAVDTQHQRLLEIINDLGECIQQETYDEKGKQIFFSLIHFADTYLSQETMLANSVSDLDYSFFRDKHKKLLSKIQVFNDGFNGSANHQLYKDLHNYLTDMYPQYIAYYTPSLVNILKENGVK